METASLALLKDMLAGYDNTIRQCKSACCYPCQRNFLAFFLSIGESAQNVIDINLVMIF